MTDDTCIWPGCRKGTLWTTVEKLCTVHVSAILAEHERSVRRGYNETPKSRPVRRRGPTWFEQRQIDECNSPPAEPTRDPGFVYYLRVGGHYKIGWAKRLEQRLKQYPPDSQVLAVHKGSRSDEAALHRRFAHLTTAGREWYPLVPDITHHIELMVQEHGTPDPQIRCGPKPTEIKRPRFFRDGPGSRSWSGGRTA